MNNSIFNDDIIDAISSLTRNKNKQTDDSFHEILQSTNNKKTISFYFSSCPDVQNETFCHTQTRTQSDKGQRTQFNVYLLYMCVCVWQIGPNFFLKIVTISISAPTDKQQQIHNEPNGSNNDVKTIFTQDSNCS